MLPRYTLAIEGGGTRSQAALLLSNGEVIQTSQGGDVNTNFTSLEQSRQAVLSAATLVLQTSGIPGEAVSLFTLALVGPRFGQDVFGGLCPNARFLHFSERDVVFARAGIYRPHGIGLVAATGATAFGMRADDGRQAFFGGWGSLLGDEGSAYAMGLSALRAAARAYEGREIGPTRLIETLCEHLGLRLESFRPDLVHLAYQKPLTRPEVGSLAVLVTRLAGEGDVLALRICKETASDLATLCLHAAHHLFAPDDKFDVVVAGGLTQAGGLVLDVLEQRLAVEFPRAIFHIGSEAPAPALGRLALFTIFQEES